MSLNRPLQSYLFPFKIIINNSKISKLSKNVLLKPGTAQCSEETSRQLHCWWTNTPAENACVPLSLRFFYEKCSIAVLTIVVILIGISIAKITNLKWLITMIALADAYKTRMDPLRQLCRCTVEFRNFS